MTQLSSASRGPLTMDLALRYAAEIAAALDAAHRRGIVHRDLKPCNVMLTKSGTKHRVHAAHISSAADACTFDGRPRHSGY